MAVQTVLRHCRRMTSTTIFGGINPEGRNSSKVLKPPGGGSSDIFGTNGGSSSEASTPARRVKNHQQSNLFLGDEPQMQTPSRNQNGKDTYSRLFGGPPPTTPASTCKNRMKSNIQLSEEINDNKSELKDDQKSVASDDCSVTDGAHNGENGHGHEEPAMANGPPVMNGNAAPVVNGNTQPAPAQRQRVPPGGFSSGLW